MLEFDELEVRHFYVKKKNSTRLYLKWEWKMSELKIMDIRMWTFSVYHKNQKQSHFLYILWNYNPRELHPEYEYNVTPMVQCRADMNHGWRCSGEGLTVLLVKSECNNICDLTENWVSISGESGGVRMVQPIRVSRDSRSSGE